MPGSIFYLIRWSLFSFLLLIVSLIKKKSLILFFERLINLYLEKGILASNAQLVEKAIEIITNMGVSILTPEETKESMESGNLHKFLEGMGTPRGNVDTSFLPL